VGLAESTASRWFGAAFLAAHPDIADQFRNMISNTSSAGFIGCARAIQGLDYLGDVEKIRTPVTLIVGANDQPLPDAMAHLQTRIPGAQLEIIPGAGHLPNIDQPDAFDAALLRHFAKFAPR
jgi:3-oxoadipate enol-lactonase